MNKGTARGPLVKKHYVNEPEKDTVEEDEEDADVDEEDVDDLVELRKPVLKTLLRKMFEVQKQTKMATVSKSRWPTTTQTPTPIATQTRSRMKQSKPRE
ncbi:hypothetical protein WOLCODRAFT_156281 [Wolfiporia cocos MD-104 SS10]|uniref:Uncharacterized protein n=1 Tax=Wolfiporia cocos (strain MD-104) TaxID=742152 RepID=A0A2H3J010_WOLCO|nr:hypothetical protein WOLCODRAFT_156281 [Wolfiporia cocos MD-104 SS10]